MVNVTERGLITELLNVRLDLDVMGIERNDVRVAVVVSRANLFTHGAPSTHIHVFLSV